MVKGERLIVQARQDFYYAIYLFFFLNWEIFLRYRYIKIKSMYLLQF